MMLKQGTWWLESKTDSRWNCTGTASVGGFEMCPEARSALERLIEVLGEPPEDLQHGYMKD